MTESTRKTEGTLAGQGTVMSIRSVYDAIEYEPAPLQRDNYDPNRDYGYGLFDDRDDRR